MSHIAPFTVVRTTIGKEAIKKYYSRELREDKNYLFLSEISNQPGHCMIYDIQRERILGPYHCVEFRICTEGEI